MVKKDESRSREREKSRVNRNKRKMEVEIRRKQKRNKRYILPRFGISFPHSITEDISLDLLTMSFISCKSPRKYIKIVPDKKVTLWSGLPKALPAESLVCGQ